MKTTGILMALFLLTAAPVFASPVEFFGWDPGNGDTGARLNSYPNSDAAKNNFFSLLDGSVGTEGFEGFNAGDKPATISFGTAGDANLNVLGAVISGEASGTGRYNLYGDKFLDTASHFTIDFSNPISAFGFYGVDMADFDGWLSVITTYSDNTTHTFELENYFIDPDTGQPVQPAGGSALYFGFYDLDKTFEKIEFTDSRPFGDFFGFDDFSIAVSDQITITEPPDPIPDPNPIPEPASMLLFGMGVIAFGISKTITWRLNRGRIRATANKR
jgi:hypothetical protein